MADVKQIYQIVNSIAEQSLGLTELTATDASFVSVGQTVLSSDINKEAWFNVLIDRIGRTVISMRTYNSPNSDLHKEPIEWGVALQKINIALPKAVKNTTWNSQSETHSDPFAKTANTVRQKFFTDFSTWEVDETVPDVQLKTAFTNASTMGAFIDGIFTAMYNSLELSYENTANLCRCAFIARKKQEGGLGYVNLLADYNALTNSTLTVNDALRNAEFLKYSARQIKLFTSRLEVMSVLFNSESVERHTPKSLQVVNVLADFATALTVYLESDTYHNEMVKLPNYKEIAFWQSSGKNYDFADVSKIDVVLDESETGGVTVTGVVAVIYDREAMGVTIDRRATRSIYNPKDEYTNYFAKADMGYYNDMSENGIVFYIA